MKLGALPKVVRRIDWWTKVLGPVLYPFWVRMEGIPLHASDESVLLCLGECLGVLMEIVEDAK